MELGTNIFIYLTAILSVASIFLLFYSLKKKNASDELTVRLRESDNLINNLRNELSLRDREINELKGNIHDLNDELSCARDRITSLTADSRSLESRIEEKDKVLQSLSTQIENSKKEQYELNQRVLNDQRTISELKTTVEKERESGREKIELLNEAKEKLSQEFQNLGNRIFEDKSKKFTEQNKNNMEVMLNPLREQIRDFNKKVTDVYDKESKERITLLKQIEHLRDLNRQISQDTVNLTNALKGQGSAQGAWGEVVLEKVLEMSGLRKGLEYSTQDTFRSWEGKRLRPDVIINLPEGKQVIVDSKVSLSAFERYSSTEDEDQRRSAIKDHLVSVNNHIRELGSKNYEDIPEIKSLNYVLMFIPVESAFLTAIENDKDLFKNAFDKNIILVCPSTLLATLRTIQSIWQFEYQSRNAQVIADRAGKLYDRFVEFTSHLENIGTRLDQAAGAHEDAMKALTTGRGNLVKQVTNLQKLGVKNKKSISENLLNTAGDPEPGEDNNDVDQDDDVSPFRSGQS